MTASTRPTERPPYGVAALVALLVLIGYGITLAPSVTFWDAGEFIAAARVLGIPHPPGTPLFTLLGHAWGLAFPVGEYAFRLNLMSAVFSAAGAGFFFLVAHATLRRVADGLEPPDARLVSLGGAAAAAVCGAFVFTAWQNSNETEVYMVATFMIAAIAWICHAWREARGQAHAPRLLLLVLYLAGLSIGNHLLALLAGPAVVAFLVHTVHAHPAASRDEQRREWAQVAVVAGVWALCIGTGLGSTALMVLGGICTILALGFAVSTGAWAFGLLALVIAMVGVTTYIFLYIRAGQAPPINEADPSTFGRLLAVIRREQYPLRTPFDDPTVMHGPGNPGRSITIIGLQLLNYVQYFDWQWANGVTARIGAFPLRTLATLGFLGLGLHGQRVQRRADRGAWWMVLMLFLVTGLGLVAYMNFRPGYSLGYELFPNFEQHEVRERDYFFLVSFVTFGVWAGIGLADLARQVLAAGRPRIAGMAVLAVALVPFLGNFTAASRRHGADAGLAADAAYNLLNSVGPYGVLFTYGDNDTFPLWWAQEVEGIRRDVTVVCLSLANTEWYIRQLRDNPARAFDAERAPAVWRRTPAVAPEGPVLSMSDAEIDRAQAQRLGRDLPIRLGPITDTLPAGMVLLTSDIVALRIVQENLGKRPIAWAITTGRERSGLDGWMVQQGLAFRVEPVRPDTTRADLDFSRLAGTPFDVPLSHALAWETYRTAGLLEGTENVTDPTALSFSNSLGLVHAQLAAAAEQRGDLEAARREYERAVILNRNPALQARVEMLQRGAFQLPGGDSGPP